MPKKSFGSCGAAWPRGKNDTTAPHWPPWLQAGCAARLLGTVNVTDTLSANATLTVTLALTEPQSLTGVGTQVWAVVDEADAVSEADESNNTEYAFFPLLPDLTLTAADISGDGPVMVTLHNEGVLTATAPRLAAWSDGLTGTLVYGATLSDPGPGAVATATLELQPGALELWVKADPDNLIAESSEGNNLAVRVVEVLCHLYLPLVLRGR